MMKDQLPYQTFSVFLKHTYGEKVYKIPIHLPVTCPNRLHGGKGCIFCDENGAGFELLDARMSISEQMEKNIQFIGRKYKAKKFILYFQNYSNTFMPLEKFKKVLQTVKEKQSIHAIVAVYISTRPDCIRDDYLLAIQESIGSQMDIVIELGLQTVNYKTLELLRRGHSLAEFIDAVLRIKKFGFGVCAHCIVDLPFDTEEDLVETAKILSALGVDQVKNHALYILENTPLGELYKKGEVTPLGLEAFIHRSILFLEYLSPHIVLQRLVGRAPKESSLFCNFGMSSWKIGEEITRSMLSQGSYQGKKFNYLNGKALKTFETIV